MGCWKRPGSSKGGWTRGGSGSRATRFGGLPVLCAEVGPADAPTVVLHGHIDVVPALPGQFEPRVEGDRLYGRGAYQ